jgi:hypothetical protein
MAGGAPVAMDGENRSTPNGLARSDEPQGRIEQMIDRMYVWTSYEKLLLPRPYLKLLDQIQQFLLPRTYVEVGVSKGTSLTLALPGTRCIGVDPDPDIQFPLGPTSEIYRLTSDDFFEQVDVGAALGGQPLDLAFIDGLHLFEYALRDFMNLERYATQDTTILIHDCLPVDEECASRDRKVGRWSGDVWKVIACLRMWRPDLDVSVVDIGPCGLAIVRGLDAASTRLRENYDEIYAHFLELPYSVFEEAHKNELLDLVPGEWRSVRPLLPSRPFRRANLMGLKTKRLLRAMPPIARQWTKVRVRRASRRLGVTGA